MELHVINTSNARQRTDCAIVGIYDKGLLSAAAREFDSKTGKLISKLIAQGDVQGKLGETLLIADTKGASASRLMLVGLGAKPTFDRKAYRKALQSALTAVNKTGSTHAISYVSQETVARLADCGHTHHLQLTTHYSRCRIYQHSYKTLP